MNEAERDEFIGKLKRWKHEGCSVLVVGEALDLVRQTSDLLLGDDDHERYRLLVLTDATPDTAVDRLTDASGADPATATRILDYGSISRSAASESATPTDRFPAVPVDGDLDRLYDELTRTMAEFDARNDRIPPSALRVGVDTLAPLLEEYDRDEVRQWLHHLRDATRSYHGIAHCLLPKPYSDGTVQQLQRAFDAVIEVRPYGDEGERTERWHVPGTDLTTPWRVMDGETRGMM